MRQLLDMASYEMKNVEEKSISEQARAVELIKQAEHYTWDEGHAAILGC